MNPTFMPVIGSGFDADAAQQQGWAGFNAGIDRQNLDAIARANAERNQWVAQQQAFDEAAKRSDIAQSVAASRDEQAQYNFGQQRADQLAQNNQAYKLQSDRLAASIDAGKQDATALSAATLLKRAEDEAHNGIFDAKNYPSLDPDHLGFLTRINALAAKPVADAKAFEVKNYFDAAQKAEDANRLSKIESDIKEIGKNPVGERMSYFNPLRYIPPITALDSWRNVPSASLIKPNPDNEARLAAMRLAVDQELKDKNGALMKDINGNVTVKPDLIPAGGVPPIVTPANSLPVVQKPVPYIRGMKPVSGQLYTLNGMTYLFDGKQLISQ